MLCDLGMTVDSSQILRAIDTLDKGTYGYLAARVYLLNNVDGNGELSFDEFMPWWTAQSRQQKRAKMTAKQQQRRRSIVGTETQQQKVNSQHTHRLFTLLKPALLLPK